MDRWIRGCRLFVWLLIAASATTVLRAQDDPKKPNKPKPKSVAAEIRKEKAKEISAKPVDPEHEAKAIEFAREHHPELSTLLEQLKQMNSGEYAKAIQELYRTTERLEKFGKDQDRRNHELKLWKLESRIKLLAARMTMAGTLAEESELKSLLLERIDLRREILQLERDRLAGRLKVVEHDIDDSFSNRETLAEKELEKLRKTLANTARGKGNPSKSPAAADASGAEPKKGKPGKDKSAETKKGNPPEKPGGQGNGDKGKESQGKQPSAK